MGKQRHVHALEGKQRHVASPPAELVSRAREGQPLAVARLISLVEDASPALREVAAALAPYTGGAHVLGLTGPPGVGKSTLTSALITAFRARGKRIGVLAVDPSSPFSGGALLGDRIRMHDHTTDPEVFIRSMATRGHLGGLAWATPQALRVLDAAGCDVILIETVGVGQSEVDIVSLADTTLVLLAPGMGDGIQAAKAGILEVADIFVVNKSDHDGADRTVHDLSHMISLGRREITGPNWRPPIIRTTATTGSGLDDLMTALDTHHTWLVSHGELQTRRTHRAAAEIEAIALDTLRTRLRHLHGAEALDTLAKQVTAGELDPYAAAEAWIASL
jgi:LAO/AO transport system kinase